MNTCQTRNNQEKTKQNMDTADRQTGEGNFFGYLQTRSPTFWKKKRKTVSTLIMCSSLSGLKTSDSCFANKVLLCCQSLTCWNNLPQKKIVQLCTFCSRFFKSALNPMYSDIILQRAPAGQMAESFKPSLHTSGWLKPGLHDSSFQINLNPGSRRHKFEC